MGINYRFETFYNRIEKDTDIFLGFAKKIPSAAPSDRISLLRNMLHRITRIYSAVQEYLRSALILAYAGQSEFISDDLYPISAEKEEDIVHMHSEEPPPCRVLELGIEGSLSGVKSLWMKSIREAGKSIPPFEEDQKYFLYISCFDHTDGLLRDYDNSDFKLIIDSVVSMLLPTHEDSPHTIDVYFSVNHGEGGFDLYVMPEKEKIRFLERREANAI